MTVRFPLNLAPNCRKWNFRDSRFQNFPGKHAPGPPRNLTPSALDFCALGARKLVPLNKALFFEHFVEINLTKSIIP